MTYLFHGPLEVGLDDDHQIDYSGCREVPISGNLVGKVRHKCLFFNMAKLGSSKSYLVTAIFLQATGINGLNVCDSPKVHVEYNPQRSI